MYYFLNVGLLVQDSCASTQLYPPSKACLFEFESSQSFSALQVDGQVDGLVEDIPQLQYQSSSLSSQVIHDEDQLFEVGVFNAYISKSERDVLTFAYQALHRYVHRLFLNIHTVRQSLGSFSKPINTIPCLHDIIQTLNGHLSTNAFLVVLLLKHILLSFKKFL